MMIRAPGVTVPGPRDGLAATVDLYPTLVELCALEDRATRHPLDGVDLGPVPARPPGVRPRGDHRLLGASGHRSDPGTTGSWRAGGRASWRDLRLIDATCPDPTAEELTAGVSPEDEIPARLLGHLVPPPGGSRAKSD